MRSLSLFVAVVMAVATPGVAPASRTDKLARTPKALVSPKARKVAKALAEKDKVPPLPKQREVFEHGEALKLPDGSVSITRLWRLRELPNEYSSVDTSTFRPSKNTLVTYRTIPINNEFGHLFIRTVVTKKPGPKLLARAYTKGTSMMTDQGRYAAEALRMTVADIVGDDDRSNSLRKGQNAAKLLAALQGDRTTKQIVGDAKSLSDVSISSLPDVWKPQHPKKWAKQVLQPEMRRRELSKQQETLFTGYMARPAANLEHWLGPQIWERLKALGPNQKALVFGPGMVDPESEAYLRNNDQSLKDKGIFFPGEKAMIHATGLEQQTIAHARLHDVTDGKYNYKSGRIERLKPGNGKGQIPVVDFAWSRFGPDNYAKHYDTAISHMLGMLKEAPKDHPEQGGVLLTHTNARFKIVDKQGNDATRAYLDAIKGATVIHFQKMEETRMFDEKGMDVGDAVAAKQRSGFGREIKYTEKKESCYQIGFQRTQGKVHAPKLELSEFIHASPPIMTFVWNGKP